MPPEGFKSRHASLQRMKRSSRYAQSGNGVVGGLRDTCKSLLGREDDEEDEERDEGRREEQQGFLHAEAQAQAEAEAEAEADLEVGRAGGTMAGR